MSELQLIAQPQAVNPAAAQEEELILNDTLAYQGHIDDLGVIDGFDGKVGMGGLPAVPPYDLKKCIENFPWLYGQGKPQVGLAAYIRSRAVSKFIIVIRQAYGAH